MKGYQFRRILGLLSGGLPIWLQTLAIPLLAAVLFFSR